MTVDDIRKLSPEQMNRMAEIRTEIEDLEAELEQLIKGGRPRRKTKKKPSSRKRTPKPAPPEAEADTDTGADVEVETAKPEQQPTAQDERRMPQTSVSQNVSDGAAQTESVLTRLALPRQNDPSSAELDS